jgi:hypothetical protein
VENKFKSGVRIFIATDLEKAVDSSVNVDIWFGERFEMWAC